VRVLRARWRRALLLAVAAVWIGVMWRQTHKPLPVGTHVASAACAVPHAAVTFIADITAADAYGRSAVSQGIFDAVLAVVRGAQRFIVLDYTAFGAGAAGPPPVRRLAAELTDALLARRREPGELAILFITDPVNEAYGAARSDELQLLRAAGIEVITTDLDRLRDSNFLYSSLWRLGLRWWDAPSGPLGVATRRLNFKASGRKLVIADDGHGGLTAVIGSANPQDRQSGWSNLAARVSGGPLQALLASELAVARFSGWRGSATSFALPGASAGRSADCAAVPAGAATESAPGAVARVQLLTEGAIRAELLGQLDAAAPSDSIDVAALHLADRGVIESLLAAARRGVSVRLILDPNETGSSGGTAGLPNQPVASELVSRSGGAIRVRWYRTHGERFHGALVMVYGRQRTWLTLGSAQLTRRSLDDYDLTANIAIELPGSAPLAQQALQYFETLWLNRAALGIEYSADFATFANPAQADYWLYRLLEGSGFASF
jgi:phosphatidylserine/phosphatidylglycerophosphate/cardiolipin synthase-like enzyme